MKINTKENIKGRQKYRTLFKDDVLDMPCRIETLIFMNSSLMYFPLVIHDVSFDYLAETLNCCTCLKRIRPQRI